MNGQIVGARSGGPWRFVGWGIAASLLLLPLFAMQFTPEVNWTASDFIIWVSCLALSAGYSSWQSGSPRFRPTEWRSGSLCSAPS